ncbi:hypothetical protein CAPTEDRAFT_190857 [Capitella teleta]|uniref:Uncharacterized protein n=1 Tax=Capitella teleta TaxID=283909 RepID=R7U8U3_CAPTE|nr:hypothetical protein CAPTEDRAFT_190857 [Capitella teleta]|eukprot:ELU00117.1 hypothetical protein CAPTEDRAFT_190857 [Capitella teleta]
MCESRPESSSTTLAPFSFLEKEDQLQGNFTDCPSSLTCKKLCFKLQFTSVLYNNPGVISIINSFLRRELDEEWCQDDGDVCAHIGDSDLVLLHFLYFLTYSFWKSSVPLGITDSCEMALIRRARKSIWKLSQLEEETVEQVLTSIEPSLMIVPRSSTKAVICANGQRKDTMKQVGDDSHADGNSKRSTPVHQSKTEINFISTNELCADLTFVSGLCMFASTIKL